MPEDLILIVAEQPWQIELAGMLSQQLKIQSPRSRIVVAATDYYTFLHDKKTLNSVSAQFKIDILTLQELYRTWQSPHLLEADKLQISNFLRAWAQERQLSRTVEELAQTNQIIYGWERDFFALPLSEEWKLKVLSDSIQWSENLVKKLKPNLIVSIERNTLCNSLIFEIAKNEEIEHITYIVSRFGCHWIPHLNFGMGTRHPLSKSSDFQLIFDSKFLSFDSEHNSPSHTIANAGLYRAAAKNLQVVLCGNFLERLPYLLGRDLKNGVSNFPRLLRQIFNRIRFRKSKYEFEVRRLEQDLFKLSLWELRQVLFYHLRLLGLKLWGIQKPPQAKYFYWGLHSRPEDSTSVLGFGRDEIKMIGRIRSLIPKNVKLLVKEHPIMFGTRSRGFYRSLRKLPNLVLVDPFSNTQDFILSSHCAGVIGISGTMLLESELLGKPAFALGDPEFRTYLSSYGITLLNFIEGNISGAYDFGKSKVNNYAQFVFANSSKYDVPYLHDLKDSNVQKMLEVWAHTLIKGGFRD